MNKDEEDESNTSHGKAAALIEWAGVSELQREEIENSLGKLNPGVASALYTLSEGGMFEEESISLRSATLIYKVIKRIEKNNGALPEEFVL